MAIIHLLPVIISILLIAAHIYRAGLIPLVFIILASVLVLIIPRSFAARIIQLELIAGGIEWIRTTINLVMIRQSMDLPWIRLALILGCVTLVTFASALVFRTGLLKRRYGLN